MVTGCGGTFGEHGGGSDLVLGAIRVINHHWIRRGQPTRLSDAFIKEMGAADLMDLIEGLTQGRYQPSSRLARLVFEVAAGGDEVAQNLIRWLGGELGEQVCAVIRQLGFESQPFDVVQIGSLFKGGPLLVDPMIETVHRLAPGACFTHLQAPPVVGGVMLGMRQAGVDFRRVRETLIHAKIPTD
jgi:N-acetylglucosamine kinase-like BadF-type ATPase